MFNNKVYLKTLERVIKLNCSSLPLIVTNFEYEIYIKNILNKLDIEAVNIRTYPQNTTAAIYLSSKLSNPDEDLLILPSDHLIKDEDYFWCKNNRIQIN